MNHVIANALRRARGEKPVVDPVLLTAAVRGLPRRCQNGRHDLSLRTSVRIGVHVQPLIRRVWGCRRCPAEIVEEFPA